MILIDTNLLLYAYHPRAAQHEPAKRWLQDALSGAELVRFAWLNLWAFLRIATNPRVFARPLTVDEAQAIVSSWLDRPNAGILDPGDRHREILQRMTHEGQASGALIMDAAIAAIAVEHGATLCTTDRDFARFPGLKWKNPIAG